MSNTKTIRNKILLRVDKDRHTKRMVGGQEIFIPNHFNPFDTSNVVQDGIVVGVCEFADGFKEIPLQAGDKVYTTHTIATEQRATQVNGETLYLADITTDIFCKIKGTEVIPIGMWCFAAPIVEQDDNFECERDSETGVLFL